MERLRSQLHETLRKAEVEEIALPAVLGDEMGVVSSASSVSAKSKRGGKGAPSQRSRASTSDSQEDTEREEDSLTFTSELDLRWRGSTTGIRGSGSSGGGDSGRRGGKVSDDGGSVDGSSGSTMIHFSASDNPVIVRDNDTVAMVDLSSLRAIAGSDRHEVQLEKEKELSKEISEVMIELEGMQPNMHAGEKYEGVVERLKDCSTDLDHMRDEAKEIATRCGPLASHVECIIIHALMSTDLKRSGRLVSNCSKLVSNTCQSR